MPLIAKSTRYAPRAVNQYVWIPTVASAATGKPDPTAAEISAGTFVTRELTDISGFDLSPDTVDSMDAATRFVGQITVSVKGGTPTLTFNGSKAGADARDVFEEGDVGFLLIAPAGVAKDAKGEVWQLEVASVSAVPTLTDSLKVIVTFSVPAEPNRVFVMPDEVTVPTS